MMNSLRIEEPSFENLCQIIRYQTQLRADEMITYDTQFERDLGITGDDGAEILRRVEQNYGINFTTESFNLAPNEYLFNPEGIDWLILLRSILRRPEPRIRAFTVGELYRATVSEYVDRHRAAKSDSL